jgi:sulfhydrogenase subunit gamma (sulfur reductase)
VSHDAILRGRDDAGGGLVRLSVEPPAEVAASYARPGQYVALGSGKAAYFVLAGDPGERTWELLLRPGGEVALAALAASLGESLPVSAAQGAGFPMDEAKGQELIMVVTGSGIAAGRPVVRARVRDGEARTTELLIGVRTAADVPLTAELREWSAAGVKVTVCLSREDPLAGRDGFASGYVQDVARGHARAEPRTKRMIFAAGVKAMIDGIRALSKDLGVHESDVRTNY